MLTIVELTMLNVSLFVCTNGRNGSCFFAKAETFYCVWLKLPLAVLFSRGDRSTHPSNTFVSRMDYFCHSWVFIRRGLRINKFCIIMFMRKLNRTFYFLSQDSSIGQGIPRAFPVYILAWVWIFLKLFWIDLHRVCKILLLASLESVYSLIWGALQIWGQGGGETLALLW